MSKIGPDLAYRIAAEQAKRTTAAATSPVRLWVYVVYGGDLELIRRAGFDLVAPLGGSASAVRVAHATPSVTRAQVVGLQSLRDGPPACD